MVLPQEGVLKNNIWIPPFTLLNPLLDEVTQTENETVVDAATNFTNVLLFKPKQQAASKAAQDCLGVLTVLPHAPLKSQIEEALAQLALDGMVVVQGGKAGGAGAGVLLNVNDQLVTLPELPLFLLSTIHKDQVPFAFCPLFTAPRWPSGRKVPVNGDDPNLMGLVAVAEKTVFV